MTVGHCAIHLGGWSTTSLPAVPWQSLREGPGAEEASKNLHLTVPKSDLILPNSTWMVMRFFMCIAVHSHRKITKVQNFNSQVCYQKRMCMFWSSSSKIFFIFKRQAILESQISAKIGRPRHNLTERVISLKMFYFFTISWTQRHLRHCVNVSWT